MYSPICSLHTPEWACLHCDFSHKWVQELNKQWIETLEKDKNVMHYTIFNAFII